MSTAANFATLFAFPFCPTNPIGGSNNFVGNLTLTQAMAIFWNLEDLTIATTGQANRTGTPVTANGSFKFKPPTATGDYGTISRWSWGDSAMLRDSGGTQPIGSLPATTHEPRERVCLSAGGILGVGADSSGAAVYTVDQIMMLFTLRLDPVNTGKYGIEYRFIIDAGTSYAGTKFFQFRNPASATGHTLLSSGTFTIGAATFDYEACFDGSSASGGVMTVTETDWTY